MMFRQAYEVAGPRGRVVWGPFPARWSLFGMALALTIVGSGMSVFAFLDQHFDCGAGPGATCTDGTTQIARAAMQRVEVVTETGAKNHKYGVVVLTLDSGSWRLMRVEPAEAREVAATIDSGLSTGGPIHVFISGPRLLAVLGVLLLAGAVVSLTMGLRRIGHFDLVVAQRTLVVRRSLFGFPLGSRSFPLADAEHVRLEMTSEVPPLANRGEGPAPMGRLALVYRNGTAAPLSVPFFAGEALHYRAAAALRRLLEMAPDPRDDAALAIIPMRETSVGHRIAFAWAGLTTGSLVGMAIFGGTLVALGRMNPHKNVDDWILVGAAVGALGGVGVVLHATRRRLPR